MPEATIEQLLETIRRSRLVDEDRLAEAVERFHDAGGEASDTELLADWLVETEGLISEWQRRQLLKGRYRGFFLKEYKLVELIAVGGMAKVYLAEHEAMGRRVAIKVLPRQRLEESSCLERFVRESQAVAALDHPNVVRAYDIDLLDDTHYIVMEYVEGRDLQRIVAEDGPLAPASAADIIRQAAEGLGHAHQAGLIHRDVKPANFMIDGEGRVRVLDLGLARFEDETRASLTITHDDGVLGTADYLAPEQAIDSHAVDARADIYALGCSLYFAIVGHPPFHEGTLAKRILMHQKSDPIPFTQLRPDAPESLWTICARMLEKSPDDRYADVYAAADALGRWLIDNGHADAEAFRSAMRARRQAVHREDIHLPDVPLATTSEEALAEKRRRRSRRRNVLDYDDESPLPSLEELEVAAIAKAALAEIKERREATPRRPVIESPPVNEEPPSETPPNDTDDADSPTLNVPWPVLAGIAGAATLLILLAAMYLLS